MSYLEVMIQTGFPVGFTFKFEDPDQLNWEEWSGVGPHHMLIPKSAQHRRINNQEIVISFPPLQLTQIENGRILLQTGDGSPQIIKITSGYKHYFKELNNNLLKLPLSYFNLLVNGVDSNTFTEYMGFAWDDGNNSQIYYIADISFKEHLVHFHLQNNIKTAVTFNKLTNETYITDEPITVTTTPIIYWPIMREVKTILPRYPHNFQYIWLKERENEWIINASNINPIITEHLLYVAIINEAMKEWTPDTYITDPYNSWPQPLTNLRLFEKLTFTYYNKSIQKYILIPKESIHRDYKNKYEIELLDSNVILEITKFKNGKSRNTYLRYGQRRQRLELIEFDTKFYNYKSKLWISLPLIDLSFIPPLDIPINVYTGVNKLTVRQPERFINNQLIKVNLDNSWPQSVVDTKTGLLYQSTNKFTKTSMNIVKVYWPVKHIKFKNITNIPQADQFPIYWKRYKKEDEVKAPIYYPSLGPLIKLLNAIVAWNNIDENIRKNYQNFDEQIIDIMHPNIVDVISNEMKLPSIPQLESQTSLTIEQFFFTQNQWYRQLLGLPMIKPDIYIQPVPGINQIQHTFTQFLQNQQYVTLECQDLLLSHLQYYIHDVWDKPNSRIKAIIFNNFTSRGAANDTSNDTSNNLNVPMAVFIDDVNDEQKNAVISYINYNQDNLDILEQFIKDGVIRQYLRTNLIWLRTVYLPSIKQPSWTEDQLQDLVLRPYVNGLLRKWVHLDSHVQLRYMLEWFTSGNVDIDVNSYIKIITDNENKSKTLEEQQKWEEKQRIFNTIPTRQDQVTDFEMYNSSLQLLKCFWKWLNDKNVLIDCPLDILPKAWKNYVIDF